MKKKTEHLLLHSVIYFVLFYTKILSVFSEYKFQASFNLQDWEAAKKDFEKVVEIEPANKAAKKQIVECQNRAKQTAGQEKELAQKMFSGLGKGVCICLVLI